MRRDFSESSTDSIIYVRAVYVTPPNVPHTPHINDDLELSCILKKIRGGTVRGLMLERGQMLENKPNLDRMDPVGRTPLHMAVLVRFEMVDHLLLYGASHNMANKEGSTIMHIAAEDNNLLVLKLAHWYGCDFTIRNRDGMTTWHFTLAFYTADS